jgi:hypothetical protein
VEAAEKLAVDVRFRVFGNKWDGLGETGGRPLAVVLVESHRRRLNRRRSMSGLLGHRRRRFCAVSGLAAAHRLAPELSRFNGRKPGDS